MVAVGRRGTNPCSVVVVAIETGVPSRSATSGCDAPEGGGGTGRPPLELAAVVVVVAPPERAVVVVVGFCVVEVDEGGTGAAVVVVVGGVVVVVDSWAITSPAAKARKASAPKSTGKARRTG